MVWVSGSQRVVMCPRVSHECVYVHVLCAATQLLANSYVLCWKVSQTKSLGDKQFGGRVVHGPGCVAEVLSA